MIGLKSTFSAPAVNYVERTFRDLKMKPDDIFRMIPSCEKESISFVSHILGKNVPVMEISHLTSAEVPQDRCTAFGYASDEGIVMIVDNTFKRLLDHVYDLRAMYGAFVAHEGVHVHDFIFTELMNAQREVSAQLRELWKPSRLPWFLQRKNPELDALNERYIMLEMAIEGRATRAEWIFADEKFIRNEHLNPVDAMYFVERVNPWYFDCARFIEQLELKVGKSAWKLSETLPPIRGEFYNPSLYAERVARAGISISEFGKAY